jgi:hypothetical protein
MCTAIEESTLYETNTHQCLEIVIVQRDLLLNPENQTTRHEEKTELVFDFFVPLWLVSW